MAGFIDNFREALRSLQPSVIAQRNVERKTSGSKKKTPSRAPQEVWGFEEDKANYGDIAAKDGDSLAWRNVTAHNDDDGTEIEFSVGYDQDGKISGVRKKDGNKITGYYGNLLSDQTSRERLCSYRRLLGPVRLQNRHT